ncbi:MAG: secondary thiamine-phosphate synthase enzyme YjbQ [archaeon]
MIREISVSSSQKQELIDISKELADIVEKSGVKEGLCNVYVPHATAGIIINENYDPAICMDFLEAMDKMIPSGVWRHDRVDGNASAHIKAAIVGPGESIPIKDGKLQLGTWQSPMLAEFDGPRNERRVLVTVIRT